MRTACSSSHLLEGVSDSVHAGIHQPAVGLETPPGEGLETAPGVGLETPLKPDPSTSPLGVGLETPQPDPSTSPLGVSLVSPLARPQTSPWLCAWRPPPVRPLNFPPGCAPGDAPPQPDPSTSPMGVGLETCKACWDTTAPLPQWTEWQTGVKHNLRKLSLRAVMISMVQKPNLRIIKT